MAANLTPQYLEAEAEYKKAKTAEERLACLPKMWSLLPKHKANEKLQAELKKKMGDVPDEVERHPKGAKKGGVSYKVPRQGAGQVILLGAPNAGKSMLLTRLTRATSEVAPYPFTSRGRLGVEPPPSAAGPRCRPGGRRLPPAAWSGRRGRGRGAALLAPRARSTPAPGPLIGLASLLGLRRTLCRVG
jgi:hypothetical protein